MLAASHDLQVGRGRRPDPSSERFGPAGRAAGPGELEPSVRQRALEGIAQRFLVEAPGAQQQLGPGPGRARHVGVAVGSKGAHVQRVGDDHAVEPEVATEDLPHGLGRE